MQAQNKNHTAYQLPVEALDIVVVEDSKPMQNILRTILLSMRVARVRVYDSPELALDAMLVEPPNLILTDWKMAPISGYQFLRAIRHRKMAPLCYVPVIFVTAFGTRSLVEKVLRAGAHHLLVKPLAPSTLYKRLLWLVRDEREYVLDEESGFHSIAGVDSALAADLEKRNSMSQTRLRYQKAGALTEHEASLKRRIAEHKAKTEAKAALAESEKNKRGRGFAGVRGGGQ